MVETTPTILFIPRVHIKVTALACRDRRVCTFDIITRSLFIAFRWLKYLRNCLFGERKKKRKICDENDTNDGLKENDDDDSFDEDKNDESREDINGDTSDFDSDEDKNDSFGEDDDV
ncbi:hypothetical protein Tco_0242824 [Tanacetum coccineum]